MNTFLTKVLFFYLTHKSNKNVFESEEVVNYYSKEEFLLQKPEETILNDLRDALPEIRMLDIGIGGGRTTQYFAPMTREYLGIDYSKNMIKRCQQRYYNRPKKILFEVVDSRDMSSIRDGYFDFVLFSFNGIDYVSHSDRLAILREIRRVTKDGGYFCFSAHNLNFAFFSCSFGLSRNIANCFKKARRLILMRLFNKNLWKALRGRDEKQQYLVFNDGAHFFGSKTYYITPTKQIEQLVDLGFSNIKVYGLSDGREIKNIFKLQTTIDPWLYYLCNKKQTTL